MKLKNYVGLVLGFYLQQGVCSEFKISNCLITFKTKGQPVLVTIDGKSEAPCTGSFIIESGKTNKSKVSMDLQKLDTGIPLRNKHLKENYLHTEKFPTATMTDLEAENIEAQVSGKARGSSPFRGLLELHGMKKLVNGTYEVKGGNNYSGQFEIDLPDFGVERPSFMGVKVVDKVFLSFKFKAE